MLFPPEKKEFTVAEAAEYLDRSPRTLEKRRCLKQDPPFIKRGRIVVYRREDLDAFLAAEQDFVQGLVTSDDIVEKIVAAAPRFSDEQRARIAAVISGGAAA